jgi:F0F1-type ATP synthase assembly protein I
MKEKKRDLRGLREAAEYSHLGLTFAALILMGIFGGKYLDKKLGTEPYLLLAGAFLGGGLGFYFIVKELMGKQIKGGDKNHNSN